MQGRLEVPRPSEEIFKVGDKEVTAQVLPFDLARAHELYKALLGPVEDMIKGKHLIIVPSGPLTSLPFHVLVTEPPKSAIPAKLADYRGVAWLGARQAVSVLPSVASLKALRQFARTRQATKPYLGIGNPLLDGPQDDLRWGAYYKKQAELARTRRCSQIAAPQQLASARGPRSVRSFASVFRGAQADIEHVRQFSPLPETADELCDIARRLGVPESEILLGASATETGLKDLSEQGRLADYAVVHFATHGALAGQVQGSTEPGLVLTPPAKGTSDPKSLERDDGFLTASEIAALKLDADWVILSACNTAGGAGESAEALSGMARAFFYAGARTLLVSHWEVGSDAAVKLSTRAFAELKSNPGIGRAEALRISMRELIEKGSPAEAHPSTWAPFVVVGEGGGAAETIAPDAGCCRAGSGQASRNGGTVCAGRRRWLLDAAEPHHHPGRHISGDAIRSPLEGACTAKAKTEPRRRATGRLQSGKTAGRDPLTLRCGPLAHPGLELLLAAQLVQLGQDVVVGRQAGQHAQGDPPLRPVAYEDVVGGIGTRRQIGGPGRGVAASLPLRLAALRACGIDDGDAFR